MEINKENGYQILVVNIKYGKELNKKIKNRPDMTMLDVPESIVKLVSDKVKFEDSIETFAYNTVTKKYGAEVNYCQVWLPFD